MATTSDSTSSWRIFARTFVATIGRPALKRLLEQIEQSIIRLDTEKTTSNWALQQAFESASNELSSLPLSGSTRRQIKKFSSGLETRLQDVQQHAGLIKQFIDLKRVCAGLAGSRKAERRYNKLPGKRFLGSTFLNQCG